MKNSKFKLVLMLLIGAVVSAASVDQAREDYYKGVEVKKEAKPGKVKTGKSDIKQIEVKMVDPTDVNPCSNYLNSECRVAEPETVIKT